MLYFSSLFGKSPVICWISMYDVVCTTQKLPVYWGHVLEAWLHAHWLTWCPEHIYTHWIFWWLWQHVLECHHHCTCSMCWDLDYFGVCWQHVLGVMKQAREWVSGKPEYFHNITQYKKKPRESSSVPRTQKPNAAAPAAYLPPQALAYAYPQRAVTMGAYSQGMVTTGAYPQGVVTMDGLVGLMPPVIRMPVLTSAWTHQPRGAKI